MVWLALLGACAPGGARAAVMRRLFEPTDMEIEDAGVMDVDMQFGPVRGEDAWRVSVPDFEIDLGLGHGLELDLDGELAVGGPDDGDFVFDRFAPDNLWPAIKMGVLDFDDPDHDQGWAFGFQIGPKIPLAQGAQGTGFEGLLLLGWHLHKTTIVLNAGGLRDPSTNGDPHPSGFETGLDLDRPLDAAGHWSLDGSIGAVTYLTPDRDQLTTSAGITWSPSDMLDLSVSALYGWLDGGDRYGVLLGVSPKFRLW